MWFLKSNRYMEKNIECWKFWECLQYEIWEYAFNTKLCFLLSSEWTIHLKRKRCLKYYYRFTAATNGWASVISFFFKFHPTLQLCIVGTFYLGFKAATNGLKSIFFLFLFFFLVSPQTILCSVKKFRVTSFKVWSFPLITLSHVKMREQISVYSEKYLNYIQCPSHLRNSAILNKKNTKYLKS